MTTTINSLNTEQLNQLSAVMATMGVDLDPVELQKFIQFQQAMQLINQGFLGAQQGLAGNPSEVSTVPASGRKTQKESNEELLSKFIEKMEANRAKGHTIRSYRKAIEQYLEWLGEKNVSDIEFEDALNYFRHLDRRVNGVRVNKPSTINTRKAGLTAFYNYLKETKEYVSQNFFHKSHLKSLPKEEMTIEVTYLTEVETERLLNTILTSPNSRGTLTRPRDYVLYSLMVSSGLRIGEATQLEFRDLDFESGVINVRAEIAKYNKARTTILDKRLEPLMGAYLKERAKIDVNEEYKDHIFLSDEGNKVSQDSSLTAIKRYARESDIEVMTNHTLRHTFATTMVKKGKPLDEISKWLGHVSPEFSYTHYVSNTAKETSQEVYNGLFNNHGSALEHLTAKAEETSTKSKKKAKTSPKKS